MFVCVWDFFKEKNDTQTKKKRKRFREATNETE